MSFPVFQMKEQRLISVIINIMNLMNSLLSRSVNSALTTVEKQTRGLLGGNGRATRHRRNGRKTNRKSYRD